MLDQRSRFLRRRIVETMRAGGRGHPASALSLVEILRVLFDEVLRYRPGEPGWPDRDRFILSKGHGCLALYVMLADKGFFPQEELARFCKADGILGGHPERGKVPGVEASTGSLGHGLSIGLGMALAARMDGRPWRVFVLLGDGECDEGSVWEAAMCAGKHGLDNLTVLVDYNRLQSYGPVAEVQELEPLAAKWRAFGFAVAEVDGHDVAALRQVLVHGLPLQRGQPGVLICHTVKGKGIPFMENEPSWHHRSRLAEAEYARMLAALETAV